MDNPNTNSAVAFRTFRNLLLFQEKPKIDFISIGKTLENVRSQELYKVFGYHTFEAFLHSDDIQFSREKAYMYIRIYKHYVQFLKADELIKNISVVRLSKMLPLITSSNDKSVQFQEIIRLSKLNYKQFVAEIAKGGYKKPLKNSLPLKSSVKPLNEERILPKEVSAFFAEIGHRNGTKLYKERGSEYFKRIAAMRKTHGRQGKYGIRNDGSEAYSSLSKRYGVSRQRISQIIKSHGDKILDSSNFTNNSVWREAVIGEYFARKKNSR